MGQCDDFGFGFTIKPAVTCHLSDLTRDLEGGKLAHNKDNSASVVIILGSLVAVLTAALLILGVRFLSWRKKQRKGTLLYYLYNISAGYYLYLYFGYF